MYLENVLLHRNKYFVDFEKKFATEGSLFSLHQSLPVSRNIKLILAPYGLKTIIVSYNKEVN